MQLVGLILLVLLTLLQYRLWLGEDGSVRDLKKMEARSVTLQQEIKRRKERNQTLEAEILDLKHGFDAVEERARQELGMIKPGETFIIQVEDKMP